MKEPSANRPPPSTLVACAWRPRSELWPLSTVRYDAAFDCGETTRPALSRLQALARAAEYFDSGAFRTDLARRVAFRTESQVPEQQAVLAQYLVDELLPCVERLGFDGRIVDNPVSGGGPFLIARR